MLCSKITNIFDIQITTKTDYRRKQHKHVNSGSLYEGQKEASVTITVPRNTVED